MANISCKISCAPTLTVPVTLEEDIVSHEKFNLIAAMNHSGNLTRRHYTFLVKSTPSSWFHCNEDTVKPSKEAALNSDTSYIFSMKMFFESL